MTKHCEDLQKADRVNYESKLASSRNKHAIFKYLKSLKGDQYPPSITNGTAHAEKDIDKAEMFNKHFCSIVCDPTYSSYQPSDLTIFGPIDLAFTKEDIIKELNVLRINKSRGPDQLPPIVKKNPANNISHSLFTIFSNLKRLSKFPSSWKHGVVTPIFKDGSKKDVKNYRPITLLSICSKVFDKLIFNCLVGHFMSTTSDSQFGFLPRRSAILQLIRSLTYIYSSISDSSSTILPFLFDFSKAIDKIQTRCFTL